LAVQQPPQKPSKGKRLGLLHRQIAQELKSEIEAGTYADGDPFPSETALVDHYGVSRVTIRSALRLLQEEGLIERIQGSGTVVHSKVRHKMLARIVDFHREAVMMGRKPSSMVLSISSRKSRIRERILFGGIRDGHKYITNSCATLPSFQDTYLLMPVPVPHVTFSPKRQQAQR
jgi:DNA-binding GntR family transcriptional regulator